MDEGRTRLKNAQNESQRVDNLLRQIAGEVRAWSNITPGQANSITIPNFSALPTVETLKALAAEVNSALLEEFNAFNQIPLGEQSLLNRQG